MDIILELLYYNLIITAISCQPDMKEAGLQSLKEKY